MSEIRALHWHEDAESVALWTQPGCVRSGAHLVIARGFPEDNYPWYVLLGREPSGSRTSFGGWTEGRSAQQAADRELLEETAFVLNNHSLGLKNLAVVYEPHEDRFQNYIHCVSVAQKLSQGTWRAARREHERRRVICKEIHDLDLGVYAAESKEWSEELLAERDRLVREMGPVPFELASLLRRPAGPVSHRAHPLHHLLTSFSIERHPLELGCRYRGPAVHPELKAILESHTLAEMVINHEAQQL
jgi:hypothetical protein